MVTYTNHRSVVQPKHFNVSKFYSKSKIWKTASLLPWVKAIQEFRGFFVPMVVWPLAKVQYGKTGYKLFKLQGFLTAQIWAAYRYPD